MHARNLRNFGAGSLGFGLLVVLACALLLPARAHAAPAVPLSYIGWVMYSPTGEVECRRGGGVLERGVVSQPWTACGPRRLASGAAYRWTGRAWASAQLPRGYVYVYPYTGNWRWAWTQSTGWLAVADAVDPLNRNNAFSWVMTSHPTNG
jgi:hypothetical protein